MTAFDGSPGCLPGVAAYDGHDHARRRPRLARHRRNADFAGAAESAAARAGRGRWEERTIALANLQVWLPRNGPHRNFERHDQAARCRRTGRHAAAARADRRVVALQWPSSSTASPPCRVRRACTRSKVPMPYRFSTRALVAGPAIPSTSFEAAGVVDKTGVVLDRSMVTRCAGGSRARLAVVVGQPGVGLRRRRTGSRDQRVASGNRRHHQREGIDRRARDSARRPPWTARLTALSGTMFGRPLTGRGEIAHRDGVFDLRTCALLTAHPSPTSTVASAPTLSTWTGTSTCVRWPLPCQAWLEHWSRAAPLMAHSHARSSPAPHACGISTMPGCRSRASTPKPTSTRATSVVRVSHSAPVPSRPPGSCSTLHAAAWRASSASTRSRSTSPRRATPVAASRNSAANSSRWRLRPGTQPVGRRVVAGRDPVSRRRCALIQPAALVARSGAAACGTAVPAHGRGARLCIEGEFRPGAAVVARALQREDWPLQRILRSLLGWREFDGRLQAAGGRKNRRARSGSAVRRSSCTSRRSTCSATSPRRAHPAGAAAASTCWPTPPDSRNSRHRHRRIHQGAG